MGAESRVPSILRVARLNQRTSVPLLSSLMTLEFGALYVGKERLLFLLGTKHFLD
jgi:hypothetical protein